MPIAPKYMQNAASRGLKLRREHGRGGLNRRQASKAGIGSGVQRAANISNGNNLSLSTLKRMRNFYNRHKKNFVNRKTDKDGKITNGYIAGLLWGFDGTGSHKSAYNWVLREINKLEK